MRKFPRQIACFAILAAPLAQFALCAQTAPAPAGVETAWDARKIIEKVASANEQLKPVLASLSPKDWYEKKGAPSTYVVQWQTAQRQVSDVEITAQRFSQKTDSLPLGLDLYFRLEALETSARSVDEGAKRYVDPTTAAKLTSLVATSFDTRQRLRDYLRDLAADQEQNFKIADAEAQRCRGIISREPSTSSNRKKTN